MMTDYGGAPKGIDLMLLMRGKRLWRYQMASRREKGRCCESPPRLRGGAQLPVILRGRVQVSTLKMAGLYPSSMFQCDDLVVRSVSRNSVNPGAAGPIGAVLQADSHNPGSAIVRNWWPITNAEWKTVKPRDFRALDELRWGFWQLYGLPRIAREQLHWRQFTFDRKQARVAYPQVFGHASGEFLGRS